MIKTVCPERNIYEGVILLPLYLLLCLAKIYFQIFFDSKLQLSFLIAANTLLAYPFFKADYFQYRVNVLSYFVLITIGEFLIIFYEDLTFLKQGIAFYLFSKIALILIFRNSVKEYMFNNPLDFFKILGPQLLSFTIGYFVYNDTNLDISSSFLIIIVSVVQALFFSYIFYFKKHSGVNFIRFGIVFLSIHDIFGGFNIFNHNVDKNFVVSFLLISIGNFILGFGLWKSRVVIH
jgi:hypothetical protein